MRPDPNRKPTKQEMRTGGKVAMAALAVIFALTLVFVWIGG